MPEGLSVLEQRDRDCSRSNVETPVKKNDRRVQRTTQMLREALLSLIQEKGFETLSVQDIIDRANVGRATFYAHFDNKEDLLVSGFDGLRATLREHQRRAHSQRGRAEERLFAFTHEMFAHVADYRHVFRAMVGKESGALVQHLLHKMIVDLVRDDLRAMLGRNDANLAPPDAVVQFLAGGLFGLMGLWAEGKLRLSVDEVNGVFRRMAVPAVKVMIR
jgi:AcrR family transcriptional regulator